MTISAWRITVCIFLVGSGSAVGAEPSRSEIGARIEGVYALQEWHVGPSVFKPPLVVGRPTQHRFTWSLLIRSV